MGYHDAIYAWTLFGNGNVEGGYNRTIDFLKKRDFPRKAGAFDRNIDVMGKVAQSGGGPEEFVQGRTAFGAREGAQEPLMHDPFRHSASQPVDVVYSMKLDRCDKVAGDTWHLSIGRDLFMSTRFLLVKTCNLLSQVLIYFRARKLSLLASRFNHQPRLSHTNLGRL
jgi:hypothetical protein